MSIDFQKFYRFIIPGSVLVATNFFIIFDIFKPYVNIYELILILGILAIILGVPLQWIYIVLYHYSCERDKMQTKEVEWLNTKSQLGKSLITKQDVYNYSNVIWSYIDSEEKHEHFSKWLRDNFMLSHSLGSSCVAIIIGFIFYLFTKNVNFIKEIQSFIWILWFVLFLIILKYRRELMKRYMKRLEIFIKLNSQHILIDIRKYDSLTEASLTVQHKRTDRATPTDCALLRVFNSIMRLLS